MQDSRGTRKHDDVPSMERGSGWAALAGGYFVRARRESIVRELILPANRNTERDLSFGLRCERQTETYGRGMGGVWALGRSAWRAPASTGSRSFYPQCGDSFLKRKVHL